VFVVTPANAVEYRAVELGPLQDGLRVVSNGLNEGDHVVINGLQRVRPGVTVAPQLVAMETPKAPADGKALVAGNQQ
jgi:membrane fusion protein, multidrug efflux system